MFYVLSVLVLALSTVSFAQDSTEVQLQTEKLAENLYTIQDTGGMGNTTVLTGKDGVLMIDTKVAASVGLFLAEIGKLCPEPVRFAVITHWHYDHVGGNETVANAGVTLIAHENVRKQMGVAHDMKVLGAEVPASPEIAKPMVTYTDRMVFHMNGEEVAVFHLGAGHTDGDSAIYFLQTGISCCFYKNRRQQNYCPAEAQRRRGVLGNGMPEFG
jgi:glyoxylase-like metal-dependent hydrolase (beta-lactamase superfamily II)